jgi:hypothetical protein
MSGQLSDVGPCYLPYPYEPPQPMCINMYTLNSRIGQHVYFHILVNTCISIYQSTRIFPYIGQHVYFHISVNTCISIYRSTRIFPYMYTTKDKADVAATIFEWQLIKKTGRHRTVKTNNARLRGGGGGC